MSEPIRVEYEKTYRVHDPSAHGVVEIGDRGLGIAVELRESREFALRVGDPDAALPSTEITPDVCKLVSSGSKDDGLILEYSHQDPDLRIQVYSTAAEKGRLRKWLVIENADTKPVMLLDIVLDRVTLPGAYHVYGGGRGWPVFMQNVGFASVEFPECENVVTGSQYSLEYYPAVVLKPREKYQTESALLHLCAGDPVECLEEYLEEIRVRKQGPLFAWYNSQGAHESEGPNEHVLNDEIDNLMDLKATWRVPMEYFVIGYGYWSDDSNPTETGDFTQIDNVKRFPGGSFEQLYARIFSSELKLGMWFGGGCPGRQEFVSGMRDSILKLNAAYGVKLAWVDIRDWECGETEHGHPAGRYMRHIAAKNLIDAFAAVKAADPEILIYATGLSRSPWWLGYADLVGTGETDVADSAAPSMRDGEIVRLDSDHRFFETDPGTCVTYSDAHYWSGRQCWRKSLLMSLARSNQLALSGQLRLLDEDDCLFLQRVYHMRKVHPSSFTRTRRVDPGAGIYGYAATAGGRGLVALYNPSWEPKSTQVAADGLGCDPSVRNVCVQLYPESKVDAIPAGGFFEVEIGPWQVLWMEVGPSEENVEPREVGGMLTKNVPLLVNSIEPSGDFPGSMAMPLEQVIFSTGSTFRSNPVLPRTWQGFPLHIDYSRAMGEIYINNTPLMWHDGASYALVWPWTRRYAMLRFGKPNLFYLATDNTEVHPETMITFNALPYWSGSACREDWPYPGNCTLVMVMRFSKDGEPHRSTHDPRLVRCAAWLDGLFQELYRVPPNVPRIRTKYSWSVFMLDLPNDWECVRAVVPKLIDCDYEVEFFLTDRLSAADYARGD